MSRSKFSADTYVQRQWLEIERVEMDTIVILKIYLKAVDSFLQVAFHFESTPQ